MLAISPNIRLQTAAQHWTGLPIDSNGWAFNEQRRSLASKQTPRKPWALPNPPRPPTPNPQPGPLPPRPLVPTPPPSPRSYGSSVDQEPPMLACGADPLVCPYPAPPPSPGPRRPGPVTPRPNVPTPPPSPRRAISSWDSLYDPNLVVLFVECLRLATCADDLFEACLCISSLEPAGTSKASKRQISIDGAIDKHSVSAIDMAVPQAAECPKEYLPSSPLRVHLSCEKGPCVRDVVADQVLQEGDPTSA
jgi:hypothetical protein